MGGAVVMNAGAYGGEMKDVLTEVTVMDEEGEIVTLPADRTGIGISYQHHQNSRLYCSGSKDPV